MLTVSSENPSPARGVKTPRAVVGTTLSIDPKTAALIAADTEPRWGRFLRVWQDLAAEKGRMPSRTEIDPVRIGGDLLSNVFLADVIQGSEPGLRFRFRLLGQAIVDRETTRSGAFLDELGNTADIATIEQQYRACLEGKVYLRQESLVWNDVRKDAFLYSVLVLPLSDDGETVSHLLGLALYDF